MNLSKVFDDAEDIKIKNKKIMMIGEKIGKIKPRAQITGIIKIKKESFKKMYKIFKSLNSKIDMTNFMNFCIKKKE